MLKLLKHKLQLSWAVKEAFDTLPSAICYFTASGILKLCNPTMYELYQKMTGRDLQTLAELKAALDVPEPCMPFKREGNVLIFPDGDAWKFSIKEITTKDQHHYTEVIFSNVTELYEKKQKLQKQSEELKAMYEELGRLSENIQDRVREQEIFNLKSLLHDQMNMGVAAIRQILRQNTASEDNRIAIQQFKRAIKILQEENAGANNGYEEFVEDARISGISVELIGEMPTDPEMYDIFLKILREASVNAARHADASSLYIEIKKTASKICLLVSNNGRHPESEVIPKGGLADLRRIVYVRGGDFHIVSNPQFLLQVTLPYPDENNQEEEKG